MNATLIEKAKNIRLFILDVDGVLTTGAIYYLSQGLEMRGFHVHDGFGLKLLQKTGITLAIISAKSSDLVAKRMQDLNISHVYLGHENKLPVYEKLKQQLQLEDKAIAYMGDDFPDLPLLRRAGLAITVPHAPKQVQEYTHFVTTKKAGKGAVREACELILLAQNNEKTVIQPYLSDSHDL